MANTLRLRSKIFLVMLAAFMLAVDAGIIWLSDTPAYVAATIRCGKRPVIASDFAAGYTYTVPGDEFYTHDILRSDYYCNEKAAKDAGYRHSTLTSAGAREAEQEWKEIENALKFSPDKVDFVAYTPTSIPDGHTKSGLEVDTVDQKNISYVSHDLMQGKTYVALFRQGKYAGNDDSSYWVCSGLLTCTAAGKDSKGRTIYKAYSSNVGTTFWGVIIGDTYFNIEVNQGAALTDAQVAAMFSSLEPVESH